MHTELSLPGAFLLLMNTLMMKSTPYFFQSCLTIFRKLSNIAMPQAVTRDSRGTVFGQPLRLERDGMEELMMPGCVSIANCHEHTAGEVPHCISTGAVGRQTGCPMNCRQLVQQHQVDDSKVCDEVALEKYVQIERQSWTHAPSDNAAENCERIEIRRTEDVRVCLNRQQS